MHIFCNVHELLERAVTYSKKLDISHEGTRTMIVKHILHRIEYDGQKVPEGVDTKEHLKYINK